MNYHPDDFLALVAAVETEGGYYQRDACEGQALRYPKPEGGFEVLSTVHCDLHARIAVTYDPTATVDFTSETLVQDSEGRKRTRRDWIKHNGETPAQAANFVPVCAVDDAVGLWPRYRDLMSDQSYQPLV